MLRSIFVMIFILLGVIASFQGSFYALLFYLWIAYFRPESWLWNDFLKGANLSYYVGIFLLLSTILTRRKFKFTPFTALLGIFLSHSLISTMTSSYYDWCWPYWEQFLKIIVISYLMTVLITSAKEINLALITITLSLGLEGAKQGLAQLILNPGAANQNEHPFLGDNNGVAVGMLMLVPLVLALSQMVKRKWVKAGFSIIAVGVAYRALSTYSRGGMVAFACMCGIWWLRSRHKIQSVLLITLIAGVTLPVFPQAFWNRMKSLTTDQQKMDSSAAGRLYFWGVAFKMAQNHPLLGVGQNGYEAAYNEYDSTHGKYGFRRSVHSMWFGILSEQGFIGLLLFISILGYSWRACIQARRKCSTDPTQKYLGLYASAIETSLLTAAIGGTFLPFQYAEILWHFFALAIVVEQLASKKTEPI